MLYVAYGSNMSRKQMAYRCPRSKIICNGELKGWKLVFNVHADIIETGNDRDIVPVVAWEIDEKDWNMLDMYEGYPNYYVKEIVDVELDSGEIEEAIVYVMAENRKGISPPSGSYFDCIYEGYMENGISTRCLFEALDYSYDNETEHNQYNPA